MRRTKEWLMSLLVLALVVAMPACTNDGLDDGDAADVVLEVVSLDATAVTAGPAAGGGCAFVVTEWEAELGNLPKNVLAGPNSIPFNDIVMESVTIEYTWINPAIVTPTRVIGLANVAIPVNGTAEVQFFPISFDDLLGGPNGGTGVGNGGVTANLRMTFRARTIEGTTIFDTALGQLFIEGCV